MRHLFTKPQQIRLSASILSVVVLAGCSRGLHLPSTIDFDGERLTQDRSWTKGDIAAVVWTRPGEKVPSASLQVGVIVSGEHKTARELNQWVSEHAGQRYYDADGVEDDCRVGTVPLPGGGTRVFMTVITCHTGAGRAACVEADEDLPIGDFSACLQKNHDCFEVICDQRWIKRRGALDQLAKNVLARR
jgi:hypothetical protein